MLYYLLFYAILGFIIHFYIIFGTNLLTGGPIQIAIFLPISVFRRKGISNGVCRHSGNGGPQTCLPGACGVAQVGAQLVAHLQQHKLKTIARGQALRGRQQEAS